MAVTRLDRRGVGMNVVENLRIEYRSRGARASGWWVDEHSLGRTEIRNDRRRQRRACLSPSHTWMATSST
jgi:hypothetical protein